MRSVTFDIKSPRKDSEFRAPVKFLAEIHIVLSLISLLCCIGIIISFATKFSGSQNFDRDVAIGVITYATLTLIVGCLDLILSLILLHAATQLSLGNCLFWYRSTMTILIVFTLQSIAFTVLLKSAHVFFGLITTIFFKPLALWVVSGFILEINKIYQGLPGSSEYELVPFLDKSRRFYYEDALRDPNASLDDNLKVDLRNDCVSEMTELSGSDFVVFETETPVMGSRNKDFHKNFEVKFKQK